MAYYSEAVKAMSSGSGKAPGIFTYNTVDLLADITTLGYFDEANFFEPNDIVYATYNDGASMAKIICVQNDRDAAQGLKIDFSVYTSFAGDIRATDLPGYQSENFGVGLGSAQGVFMQYSYRNNTDTKALILAADYFKEAGVFLEIGDVVETVSVDGTFMMMVTAADATTTTMREIIFV